MQTIIKNGRLVLPDQILDGYALILESGKIAGICPERV